jgi:diketogulonate reductase-like aldo/keto reductase
MPLMAYSPIEQGRMPDHPALRAVGEKHGLDRFGVALAWVLNQDGVIAIPKAVGTAHLQANRRAAEIRLDAEDLAALDRAFPPPLRKQHLEML